MYQMVDRRASFACEKLIGDLGETACMSLRGRGPEPRAPWRVGRIDLSNSDSRIRLYLLYGLLYSTV